MNKKQIIGLIAAGLVFTFVGVISAITNVVSGNIMSNNKEEVVNAFLKSTENATKLPDYDFIGLVKVEGTIANVTQSSGVFASDTGYNHQKTLTYIDEMMQSTTNKGILLYVNSPGGGVYESDELYLKLKEYKEKTERPIWTYMSSMACSGGYYISMASDKIYANRNTMTGSIGVIMSINNMKGLYDKLGIEEINITSGPNKAIGHPGIEMTEEHKEILQSMVNESYEQFVSVVSEGRNMDVNTVKPIADGRIYTAKQALELNLIDEIDNYEDMQNEMISEIGQDAEIFVPAQEENALLSILSKAEKLEPKSDAQVLTEYLKEKESTGGLMYYAK